MAAVAAVALAVTALSGGGGDDERATAGAAGTPAGSPAAPPKAAFRIGPPVALGDARHETRWSPVRRAVVARTAPRRSAGAVARLARRTPEGTTNLVVALARRRGDDGRLWIRVRLPGFPGRSLGWVPRTALGGYGVVTTHLVVDRDGLTLQLFDDGRRVLRAPIGVGTAAAPTPRGDFYVRNELTRYRSPFYGPLAFGTSARSPTVTDWPGGGFIGIHGTDRPELLPGRVSHGCIRVRNADMLRLARLMPIGTPITIR